MQAESTAPRVRTRDYASARHLQQQRASTRASRGPVLLAVAYSRERAAAGLAKAWPRAGLQRRLPGASRAIWKYFYYKIPTLKLMAAY